MFRPLWININNQPCENQTRVMNTPHGCIVETITQPRSDRQTLSTATTYVPDTYVVATNGDQYGMVTREELFYSAQATFQMAREKDDRFEPAMVERYGRKGESRDKRLVWCALRTDQLINIRDAAKLVTGTYVNPECPPAIEPPIPMALGAGH